MNSQHENLITWVLLALGFLTTIALAGRSMEFQDRCEARCGNPNVITPLVGFQETCFCEDFHGKWRRVDVEDVTGSPSDE